MKARVLNFDQFCDTFTGQGIRVFILLLEEECPFLNNSIHWVHNTSFDIWVVRLTKDDFATFDTGVHPKTLFFYNGHEIGPGIKGLPKNENQLKNYLGKHDVKRSKLY